MFEVQINTANTVMVRMLDSTDHVTGKTGLTLAVTLSKNGGAFASISPVVTERGSGWYSIDLTSSHCDTLGELVVMATSAGSDPGIKVAYVVSIMALTMSEVQICNMALARCGVSMFIQDVNEATQQANVCGLFYAQVRDRVLEAHPWNFATRRATLQDIGTPPAGWAYRYRYPNDCIKIRKIINPAVRTPVASGRIPFVVADDDASSSTAILCDMEAAEVEYTGRITNVTRFPVTFTSAVAWLLASEIAIPLTSDASRGNAAYQAYVQVMLTAASHSLEEMQEDQEPESDFIAARS